MKAPSFLFLLLVFLLISCQKEATSPKEESELKDITEASIGASGGSLQTESFTLTIPTGAFVNTEDLNLVELTDTGVFGDNTHSIRYKIEGLPETYEKPLKLCIAYQGTLAEETFILIGEEAMNPESGAEEIFYNFLNAVDSSGYLICSLPGYDEDHPADGLKKATPVNSGKQWISVEVVSDYFSNFFSFGDVSYKIYLPAGKKEYYSPMIIDYLDNAYTRINHSILEYQDAKYINIYNVFMANLAGDDYCRFAWRNGSSDNKKEPKGILAVNVNKVDDSDMMRIMIGREVLRSLLFCFDHEYPNLRQSDKIAHHWLDQAVLSWSETEFAHELDRVDHIPSDFKGNELKPFIGLHAGIMHGHGDLIQNITDHGRGMAAFIQFLMDNYLDIVIPGIYSKISEGSHPVDAIRFLLETFNKDLEGYDYRDEWIKFLTEYLKGNFYKVPAKTFVGSIPAEHIFSINNDDDTAKIFQGTYPDLSVKLHKIDINNQDFKERGTLEFSLTGGSAIPSDVGIVVFGYDNDKITFLGDDGSSLDAKQFQAYNSILVLIYNATASSPYTGNSTIEFKARASKSEALSYNRCQLDINCIGNYEYDRIPPVNPEPAIGTYAWRNVWKTVGSCSGNVYTGTLDPEFHGDQTTGTITVNFDKDQNISTYELYSNYSSESTDTVAWSIKGIYLDKSYESGNSYLQHEVSGTGVCETLKEVTFYSESPDASMEFRRYNKMISHLCDESSHLKFTFSPE